MHVLVLGGRLLDFLDEVRARVVSAVAVGVNATRSPLSVAWAAISKMSRRISGSPPVRTRFGRLPKPARSSTSALASAVSSSSGSRRGWASARQWAQA